jgi:hypothetical protein
MNLPIRRLVILLIALGIVTNAVVLGQQKAPQGFQLVLMVAHHQPGASSSPSAPKLDLALIFGDPAKTIPAGAAKAVKDAATLLPYNVYTMMDVALIRGARPSADPQSVRLQGPGGREYVATFSSGPADGHWFVHLALQDLSEKDLMRTAFPIRVGETVFVGTSTVKGTADALVLLVTALQDSAFGKE